MSSWTDEQWTGIQQRLAVLQAIPDGWDGRGSERIADKALQGAELLLDIAEFEGVEPPQLSPTGMSGVNLDWSRGRLALELEAMPDGSVEYLYVDPDNTDHEGSVPDVNNPLLVSLIGAFLNGRALDRTATE